MDGVTLNIPIAGVPDYRKTFDSQRSNLLATEMKNNAARLAKYTITVSEGCACIVRNRMCYTQDTRSCSGTQVALSDVFESVG